MKVTLYATHCPCCELLERSLREADIAFEQVTDTQIMLEKGFTSVPMLDVDGQMMNYPAALKWLRERTAIHASHQV